MWLWLYSSHFIFIIFILNIMSVRYIHKMWILFNGNFSCCLCPPHPPPSLSLFLVFSLGDSRCLCHFTISWQNGKVGCRIFMYLHNLLDRLQYNIIIDT